MESNCITKYIIIQVSPNFGKWLIAEFKATIGHTSREKCDVIKTCNNIQGSSTKRPQSSTVDTTQLLWHSIKEYVMECGYSAFRGVKDEHINTVYNRSVGPFGTSITQVKLSTFTRMVSLNYCTLRFSLIYEFSYSIHLQVSHLMAWRECPV